MRVFSFYMFPPFVCFILLFGFSKLLFAKLKLIPDENITNVATPSARFIYVEKTDSELLSQQDYGGERDRFGSTLTPDFMDDNEDRIEGQLKMMN